MVTDPLFYRLFAASPETFFLLLGMSLESARSMAARYQFQAIEFKQTSHRTDGVFLPKEAGLPLYFLEVQFYALASVYADVCVKAYGYLKQHDPAQRFCAVVLFASRDLEPDGLVPYQPLLDAGLIRCFYLDEMPDNADSPLGLSILRLIQKPEDQAPRSACELIVRAESEIRDEALRVDLIELIETVVLYKLPRLTREEIQAMLKIHDIRESRVYQEAREEGIAFAIAKLAAKGMSAEQIAAILELDLAFVNRAIATPVESMHVPKRRGTES